MIPRRSGDHSSGDTTGGDETRGVADRIVWAVLIILGHARKSKAEGSKACFGRKTEAAGKTVDDTWYMGCGGGGREHQDWI